MKNIKTHWSHDNALFQNQLHKKVEEEITTQRKSKRHRRIWFYFFEKEIRQDILEEVRETQEPALQDLDNTEYQALIARSAVDQVLDYQHWDELTLVTNDYLFGQGSFFELPFQEADHIFLTLLTKHIADQWFAKDKPVMSDVMFELRRARADIALVGEITSWQHDAQSLLKRCSIYIGSFAQLPRFVGIFGEWSQETLFQALQQHEKLLPLLQPDYLLDYAMLEAKTIQPYGSLFIQKTPYAHMLWKFWRWLSQQARYIKILLSLSVIFVSWILGGKALIIVPLVWWLFAIARSSSQYLGIAQEVISRWYHDFDRYHKHYLQLYDTMLDPQLKTKDTLEAERLMSQWFDIVPFSGHELLRNLSDYATTLYQSLMSFSRDSELTNTIANMDALYVWSRDHHLLLGVVPDAEYPEQTLYRFVQLLKIQSSRYSQQEEYKRYFSDHLESIDSLVREKVQQFWSWTFHKSLKDGVVVAVSSGVLGWMGSYLWNRWLAPSTTLAAWPHLLAVPSLTHADVLFDSDELVTQMESVMSSQDIQLFAQVLQDDPSATLWDTFVDTFWSTQGNIYTNHLMDTWWRISDDQLSSSLFDKALAGGLPLDPTDAWWTDLIDFLHRTYDYDNLIAYNSLIDQPWLENTLQDLQSWAMDMSQFSSLSLEQREIITQAMFYHLDVNDLQSIFHGSLTSLPVDWIIQSWSTIVGDQSLSGETDNLSWSISTSWSQLPSLTGDENLNQRSWDTDQLTWNGSIDLPLWDFDADAWYASFQSWIDQAQDYLQTNFSLLQDWFENLACSFNKRFDGLNELKFPKFNWPNLPSIESGHLDVPPTDQLGSWENILSGAESSSWWSQLWTLLHSTPQEGITQTWLTDTGMVDTILSWLHQNDSGLSDTLVTPVSQTYLPPFTVPVLVKDKKYK